MIQEEKKPDEISRELLFKIIEKVHLLTGIKLNDQKKSMLQSRLRKRMRHLSLATYEEYMAFLETERNEVQQFINIVTTNETSFFRTPKIWEFFQNEFLPTWFAKNQKGQLKLWSAASSSGEEAYSLAICCQEFSKKNPGFGYKIFASDISTQVLADAEAGVFSLRAVEFLKKSKPQLFEQYFTTVDEDTFKISAQLKAHVSFGVHNLFTVKKEKFDIVFLRNVLIYFSCTDQEIVLAKVGESLDKDGTLVIGESESLNRLSTPYEFKVACIYGKK